MANLKIVPASPALPPCPYRGLFAFREEDATYFFGRETYCQKLLEAALQKPLVMIVGPSGSGKSSIVFAGLFPPLRTKPDWLLLSFRPTAQPLNSLARALLAWLEPDKSEVDRLVEAKKLAENWRRGELTLLEVVGRLLEKTAKRRLLLVADQFEELYTLCQEASEQKIYLDLLLTATQPANTLEQSKLTVVCTLRADFFGYALSYRPLADVLGEAGLELGPMNRVELQAAIVEPATKLGVAFEEGLTERILEVVTRQPGYLPLLEFTLTLMWDRQQAGKLTHAAYAELGGVEKAMAKNAEEVYNRLTPLQQQQVQHILLQLVRPGDGTRDTRRLATRAEIGEERWPVVTMLATERLVVSGRDEGGGQETVEIVHEALIGGWQRLTEWLDQNRQFRSWQEQLRAGLRQWEASGRDEGALLRGGLLTQAEEWLEQDLVNLSKLEEEYIIASRYLKQRAESRRRAVLVGLVLGLTLTLVLAAVALFQWNEAEQQRQFAESRQHLALARQLSASSISVQSSDSELSLLLAQEAVKLSYDRGEPVVPQARTALHLALEHIFPLATISVHRNSLNDAIFSPNGRNIVTSSGDGSFKFWNWDGNKASEVTTLTGYDFPYHRASFSPDSKSLVTTSGPEVKIFSWDGKTSLQKDILNSFNSIVQSAVFSPDGRFILAGSSSGQGEVFSWDGEKARLFTTFNTNFGPILQSNFSPDGRFIIIASQFNTAAIWAWDGNTAQFKVSLQGHTGQVNSAVFSSDGKFILTASHDGTAKVWSWDGENAKLVKTLTGHTGFVWQATFSQDGRFIVTAGEDATAKVWAWDGSTANLLTTLVGHTVALLSAYFSPDGKTILTSSIDGTAKLWPWQGIAPGELAVMNLPYNQNSATGGAGFSPDGRYVISTNHEGQLKIWGLDGKTTTELAALQSHNQKWTIARFSPDSKKFITFGVDFSVRLWSWDGKQAIELTSYSFPYIQNFIQAGFSSRGPYILNDTEAGVEIFEFDGENLTERTILRGHSDVMSTVNFSQDGKQIVTSGFDKLIKVWNWDGVNATEVETIQNSSPLISAVFSPDGKTILTSDKAGNVKLYYTKIEDLLVVAQSRLTRELSPQERAQYGLEVR